MLEGLILVVLAPILLWQGKIVRKNIISLSEPPGERKGHCGTGPELKLMIFGDSAAAGVGARHQRLALAGQLSKYLSRAYSVSWQLCAKSGETTLSAIELAKSLDTEDFDVVVVSLGVNDVTANVSINKFTQHTTNLIQLLRTKFCAKHIVFSELPPMGIFPALPHPLRWYLGRRSILLNSALKKIAQKQQCHCVAYKHTVDDNLIAVDGFHPGETTYRLWAKSFSAEIDALCRQNMAPQPNQYNLLSQNTLLAKSR